MYNIYKENFYSIKCLQFIIIYARKPIKIDDIAQKAEIKISLLVVLKYDITSLA